MKVSIKPEQDHKADIRRQPTCSGNADSEHMNLRHASFVILSAFVVFTIADARATICAVDQLDNNNRIRVETKPLAEGLQTYIITLPPIVSDKPLIEISLWVSSNADGSDEKLVIPLQYENRSESVNASFIAQPGWQSLGLVATYGKTIDPCEWTYVGIDNLDEDVSE